MLKGKVHLFYQTYGNGKNDAICHAWSDDGNSFTRNSSNPIFKPTGSWTAGRVIDADVIEHDGKLYMFYAGGYNNEPQQIGCAVSSDGVSWKRLFTEPFLANGKLGAWNSSESGHPYAFTDQDGTTYLFYQGNNDKGKSWYLSQVKIGWKEGLPFVDAGK